MMQASIQEIAEVLKVHRTTAVRMAKAENWLFERKPVKGGMVKIFNVATLPDKIRKAIVVSKLQAEQHQISVIGEQPSAPKQQPPPSTDAAKQRALYKADLLSLYNKALDAAPWGEKVKARDEFIAIYNSGIVWPNLLKEIGQVSWKTLEFWNQKMKKHHNDCFFLVDQRGSHARGKCGLTDEQTAIFLRCVLRPNKPRIAESYRIAKAIMKHKGIENRHSEATYRRLALNWKSRNYDLWVWAREGAKAWNDKCAMYIERDMNLLQVGDVIVADGHNLNFEIINPWTGKPTNHMTLILFYDMRSNMPLGWEIMPTENTAAISSALRRAVLRLGKYPRVVYLDNGKAFKSRFFKGSEDFDTAGYGGLYKRMGCQTIYAWPYHGQSKTVERFFGTFGELERLSPTYTGNSIANKPRQKVISYDAEKIRREVEEMQRLQKEAEERDFRDSLMKLDEGDRYERLIELTAQGVDLGPEWTGFMAFFEQTSAYTSFPEYWESCRVKYGLMWRAMGAAPTGA
ncbi:MAG: transposase family protein [Desulfobulbaceae bacterium]|nr:MAG: transposase family protein [Desulfobulbaceae bacterium]